MSLACIKMHPAMYWAYTSFDCGEMCCICFFVFLFLFYCDVLCLYFYESCHSSVNVSHLVCQVQMNCGHVHFGSCAFHQLQVHLSVLCFMQFYKELMKVHACTVTLSVCAAIISFRKL